MWHRLAARAAMLVLGIGLLCGAWACARTAILVTQAQREFGDGRHYRRPDSAAPLFMAEMVRRDATRHGGADRKLGRPRRFAGGCGF